MCIHIREAEFPELRDGNRFVSSFKTHVTCRVASAAQNPLHTSQCFCHRRLPSMGGEVRAEG